MGLIIWNGHNEIYRDAIENSSFFTKIGDPLVCNTDWRTERAIQINAGSLMLKRTNFVAHHSSLSFDSWDHFLPPSLCSLYAQIDFLTR